MVLQFHFNFHWNRGCQTTYLPFFTFPRIFTFTVFQHAAPQKYYLHTPDQARIIRLKRDEKRGEFQKEGEKSESGNNGAAKVHIKHETAERSLDFQ